MFNSLFLIIVFCTLLVVFLMDVVYRLFFNKWPTDSAEIIIFIIGPVITLITAVILKKFSPQSIKRFKKSKTELSLKAGKFINSLLEIGNILYIVAIILLLDFAYLKLFGMWPSSPFNIFIYAIGIIFAFIIVTIFKKIQVLKH